MTQFKCLVLEDSLSDQLSIEMVLCQFPEIETCYISTPTDFLQEIASKQYNLIIVDIHLQSSVTGIELIQTLKNAGLWVIICSSYDSGMYYEQYKSLPLTKFYLQKPLDEFVFRTHLESFLFAKANC
ncbi:MAG: response regulator [Bacteroidota bacterium]